MAAPGRRRHYTSVILRRHPPVSGVPPLSTVTCSQIGDTTPSHLSLSAKAAREAPIFFGVRSVFAEKMRAKRWRDLWPWPATPPASHNFLDFGYFGANIFGIGVKKIGSCKSCSKNFRCCHTPCQCHFPLPTGGRGTPLLNRDPSGVAKLWKQGGVASR